MLKSLLQLLKMTPIRRSKLSPAGLRNVRLRQSPKYVSCHVAAELSSPNFLVQASHDVVPSEPKGLKDRPPFPSFKKNKVRLFIMKSQFSSQGMCLGQVRSRW